MALRHVPDDGTPEPAPGRAAFDEDGLILAVEPTEIAESIT